jgi:glucose/arabinose dehydrogenase
MRAGAALLAIFIIVSSSAVQPAIAHTETPVPSAGFRDDTVITGLTLPTTVRFAPNGDIFVSEKSGLIKRFTSLSDTVPDITANLQTEVYNYFDRGLLGMAVDPQYPQKPYLYALYSRDAPIGGTTPTWGSPTNGGNDTCRGAPNGPGASVDGCVTSGRVLRLTIGSNGLATAQKVLVDGWCGQFTSHSIGTVLIGPDGYLYAGGGDGASFSASNLDYGQLGGTIINPATDQPYTPRNPCGDPPGGVGGSMTLPTAEGGAMRTQDKRTPNDPTALNGTIIRVDRSTGLAAPSNPSYVNGHDENDRRIIAFGLRNPYRFSFRPGTSEIWIGDVGAESWEEFDRILSPTNPIRNFGWPCYEGDARNSNWDALNVNLCENLYAAGSTAVQKPYFSYYHLSKVSSTDPCPSSGGVISGVTFYTGNSYPARLKNAMFFTDYSRRCIWAMRAGTNGVPDKTQIETIDQIADGPVDLVSGLGGDIFYVDHLGGTIHRLVYTSGNRPPTVVATATPANGPAPLQVSFNASGSFDPDGNAISFAWDLDGDGAYDDANTANTQRTYAAGTWLPAVRVTDSKGAASTQGFVITSGNSAPTPVIDSPGASLKWKAGQTINFAGHATDPEDGALAAAKLSWRVILHHCTGPGGTDCHQHVIQDFDGVASESFQAPDHDLPAHLELRLTATDSGGLSKTVSVALDPLTVNLTFATNPAGLTLTAGTSTHVAPFTRTFIVDGSVSLSAPPDQIKDGLYYSFSGWSDGLARTHTIKAPASSTTYTAGYANGLPTDAANTCAGASTYLKGAYVYNTLSSTTDVDWYKFNVTTQLWNRITLAGLTANYSLELYSACGTKIATSDRTGSRFEEIYRELPVGAYYVRVRYISGTVSTTRPYGLKFSTLAEGMTILSSSSFLKNGKQIVVGELLNNTGDKRELAQVTATYFNAADQAIARASALTYLKVVPSRGRTPFKVSLTQPAAYDHYSVEVEYSQRSQDVPVGNLTVTSSSLTSTPAPSLQGSFKNNNGFGIHAVNSIATLYDRWAVVINARDDNTSPSSLSAGATATYNSTFGTPYAGWNYATVLLEATRN